MVSAGTAKNRKVKWSSEAWNGTVYVGSYVTILRHHKNCAQNFPEQGLSHALEVELCIVSSTGLSALFQ